jgi:Flp pilus assembly protein TadG
MKWVLWGRSARRIERKRRERGTIAVITAMGMMVFLLCAGYAVDISHLYLAGAELQNAADAAAIAGASELNGFATGITAAVDAALATPNRYEFGKEVATFTRADVKFAVNLNDFNNGGGYSESAAQGVASKIRFVNVKIHDKPISVPFIGDVVNSSGSSNIAAVRRGVAGQAGTATSDDTSVLSRQTVGNVSDGLKALSNSLMPVPLVQELANRIRFMNLALYSKADSLPLIGASFGSGAANLALITTGTTSSSRTVSLSRQAASGFSSGLNVLCDSIVPLSVLQDDVTQAPLDVNPQCPNKWEFTPGCKYVIRRGSNGNGSGFVEPGNYLVLALTPNRGGNDARCGTAGGASGCFKPGDEVGTETGVNAGPITQGLNTRFGDYGAGLDPTMFPPDLNVKEKITYAQYRSGQAGHHKSPNYPGRNSRRIIIIPVVNVRDYDNGRGTVKIHKFAAFFLQEKVGTGASGDIWAEYITNKVQVNDGYIVGGSGDTQFSIPVLYR